jgi:hypothetical protein
LSKDAYKRAPLPHVKKLKPKEQNNSETKRYTKYQDSIVMEWPKFLLIANIRETF